MFIKIKKSFVNLIFIINKWLCLSLLNNYVQELISILFHMIQYINFMSISYPILKIILIICLLNQIICFIFCLLYNTKYYFYLILIHLLIIQFTYSLPLYTINYLIYIFKLFINVFIIINRIFYINIFLLFHLFL